MYERKKGPPAGPDVRRKHYREFNSLEDVRYYVAKTIRMFHRGEFDSEHARTIGYLCGQLIKIFQNMNEQRITELEGRVEGLIQRIEELKKQRTTVNPELVTESQPLSKENADFLTENGLWSEKPS